MAEILYAPGQERVVTANAWAFMHRLQAMHQTSLCDWAALQRWSVTNAAEFAAAIARFARLPDRAIPLARHAGAREALVFRKSSGARLSVSRDELRTGWPPSSRPGWEQEALAILARRWSASLLARPLADLLLLADLRPDDRLLVTGPPWPWLIALLEGTTVILAAPSDVLAEVAHERATVLVATARLLAEVAFQRRRGRPDLGSLRTIVATGGPLSPEGRRRIYTWIKSDLMLLARTSDTYWGNPLEPVLARPPATPAFLTPRASAPATR
jgi:hypothetical protein